MRIEFYKCTALTVIALMLGFVAWKVQFGRMTVIVRGGQIDVNEISTPVEVTGRVDVEGSLDVDNTVDVSGSVSIEQ